MLKGAHIGGGAGALEGVVGNIIYKGLGFQPPVTHVV